MHRVDASFLSDCSVCHAAGMTVRPYPSAGRALRQILRRHRNDVPAASLPGGREAAERLQAGLAAQPGAGDYVLSTRCR